MYNVYPSTRTPEEKRYAFLKKVGYYALCATSTFAVIFILFWFIGMG